LILQEESQYEKLFSDGMQCVHVGFQESDPGCLGCLVYNEVDRGEEFESFLKGTGKNFYCPAWENLTDEQIVFAARLMGDWYYYSLFINHIEAVHEICAIYTDPEDIPDEELAILKEELVEKFIEEDGK